MSLLNSAQKTETDTVMPHGWCFRKECKKDKVVSVLLRKVKGQELVMKGVRLIKSKVKSKVSYLVGLLFSNQSWP